MVVTTADLQYLTPHEYIVQCGRDDPVLLALGVKVTADHSDIQPGIGVLDIPTDPNQQIAPLFRAVPVIYYELGTNYENAMEGDLILDHVFRIDCRDKLYKNAEAIRQAMLVCLRRGGRLAREGSRFDAYDPALDFHRRIQEINIEP